jgi:hypothetical protein
VSGFVAYDDALSAGEQLDMWEAVWGRLTPELRGKFLGRQEVGEICQYPRSHVKQAIARRQKLVGMRAWLRDQSMPTWYWDASLEGYNPARDYASLNEVPECSLPGWEDPNHTTAVDGVLRRRPRLGPAPYE